MKIWLPYWLVTSLPVETCFIGLLVVTGMLAVVKVVTSVLVVVVVLSPSGAVVGHHQSTVVPSQNTTSYVTTQTCGTVSIWGGDAIFPNEFGEDLFSVGVAVAVTVVRPHPQGSESARGCCIVNFTDRVPSCHSTNSVKSTAGQC